MKKNAVRLLALLLLLGFAGCEKSYKATIQVNNAGTKTIYVDIDENATTIEPGKSDSITITWAGSSTTTALLSAYAVTNPNVVRSEAILLNPGDLVIRNIVFN